MRVYFIVRGRTEWDAYRSALRDGSAMAAIWRAVGRAWVKPWA